MSQVPFDPNGMVMDLLRSCYKQRIRFVAGDLATQEVATWYFAAPTAKPFPFDHAFGSPTWDAEHPSFTDLGFNASAPRTYYNGRRLNRSDGTTFAGPASDFRFGAPGPNPLPRGTDETPRVCIPSPTGQMLGGLSVGVAAASGGLRTGGVCVPAMVPGVPCGNCPTVTPLTVTLTLSGFDPAHAWYNGTHTLVQQASPCNWLLTGPGTLSINLFRNPSNTWDLFLTGSAIASYYSGVIADCISPGTIAKVFSVIGGDPTVTLSVP